MNSNQAVAMASLQLCFGIFALLVPCVVVGCYNSIINFGDSLSDTGNLFYTCSSPDPSNVCFLPYGQTFFHRPTGRFSDGRLILDFIAMSLGLPLVRPYRSVAGVENFGNGMNFAVGGATALDLSFFEERGIQSAASTEVSLRLQLQSFNKIYSSICASSSSSSPMCRDILKNSLFIMGEIGGNDYNYFLIDKRNFEEVKSIVPLVVKEIATAIMELIELGAETIMVPGNLPIGCLPTLLQLFKTSNQDEYDPKNGCLKWMNQFSEYHNQQLQQQLKRIQALFPHVHLIYADYFNAALGLFNAPQDFGLMDPHKVCCLDGNGSYDFPIPCGLTSTIVCEDTSKYVSWDGLHLTEGAYKLIANGLLHGPFTTPPFNISCVQQNSSTKLIQLQ